MDQMQLNSAFIRAVWDNDLALAKEAVAQGASVNAVSSSGDNALIYAARQGALEMVSFLIESGIDKNYQNVDRMTALHTAAQVPQEKIVGALLAAQAAPDIRDNWGMTAAFYAASWGHLNIVKMLAETGADLSITDKSGLALIEHANANKHRGVADYLKSFPEEKKRREMEQELSVFKKGLLRPMIAPQKLRPVKAPKAGGA